MAFIILLITFVVFLSAFVIFTVVNIKMSAETFNKLCSKKVSRIAKRNKYLAIANLNISNYSREKLGINHVVFGSKYIYLVTDYMLKGVVSGEVNDNSWVYYNNIKRTTHYVSNLNMISDKNIQEFAGILGIKEDFIVSISLIPNECDFKINGLVSDRKFVVHYSSLNRCIKKLEQDDVDSLDKNQTYEQFKTIEKRNEEGQNN